MISISKKLLSHFREIEIIKKGNKIVGIKPFDLKSEFSELENELFLLIEQQIKAKDMLREFEEWFDVQEESNRELTRILKWDNKKPALDESGIKVKVTDADKIHFVTGTFSLRTGIDIVNWRVFKGTTLTPAFVDEFLRIMGFRSQYIFQVVRQLRKMTCVSDPQISKNEPEISLPQIALIYVHNEMPAITRKTANEIAALYGHESGEKLYHEYTKYRSTADRKAKPNPLTKTTLKNKINRFESVLPHLTESGKARATKEINILKNYVTEL